MKVAAGSALACVRQLGPFRKFGGTAALASHPPPAFLRMNPSASDWLTNAETDLPDIRNSDPRFCETNPISRFLSAAALMHCKTGAGCRLLLYDGRNLTLDYSWKSRAGRISRRKAGFRALWSRSMDGAQMPALSKKVLFRAQSRKLTGRHEGPESGSERT